MPLTEPDRKFLETIDRFKIYLLMIAGSVLVFLLLAPAEEMRPTTSVIGVALCGIFWLTQRLLTYISVLDLELTRVVEALKKVIPEEERQKLSSSRR